MHTKSEIIFFFLPHVLIMSMELTECEDINEGQVEISTISSKIAQFY